MSDQSPDPAAGASLLVEVSEAARLLGLSKMTIYRRIRSGDWPSGRCGRKHLLPRAFVMGLVAEIASGRQVNADQYAATAWPAKVPGSVAPEAVA